MQQLAERIYEELEEAFLASGKPVYRDMIQTLTSNVQVLISTADFEKTVWTFREVGTTNIHRLGVDSRKPEIVSTLNHLLAL